MKAAPKWIGFVLFLLCLFELAFRGYWANTHGLPFWQPEELIFEYYPELKEFRNRYLPEQEGMKILVLGGSVVYSDSILLQQGDHAFFEKFCDLQTTLPLALKEKGLDRPAFVYSLAQPAHNSLDSWYKLQLLDDFYFDFVIWYHGINDNRTNNCTQRIFQSDYRHIAFYNELGVYFRHPEKKWIVTPYTLDWLCQRMRQALFPDLYIPKEFLFDKMAKSFNQTGYEFGSDIKSAKPFRKNLNSVVDYCAERKIQVIVPTFATHFPEDYSLQRFKDKSLDYDAQIFPAELYGAPENLKKGVTIHNQIIWETAQKKENILVVPLAETLPPGKEFYDDPCHLSDGGCKAMTEMVTNTLLKAIQ